MSFITQTQGYGFLGIFAIAMILITYLFARWKRYNTKEGFLVAGRNVKWWLGGPSIAASWIWAGALFVSVQMAYEKGLAGIFWFTFPNVLALLLFAFWAPKIREKFPEGYTLPQYIKHKLGSNKVHKLFLVPFFFNQLMAITFNIFAGGTLFSFFTGIPLTIVMPILVVIALIYTLISGIEASIVTDLVQMLLIISGILLIVPLILTKVGGFSMLNFGGMENLSLFDPWVAFSIGIVSSIGLISETIVDQQYWQRSFAMKKSHLSKAFIFGGILFALVPLSLSLLGFIGANSSLGIILPEGVDNSMIGVFAVSKLLPSWVLILFVLVLLGGLSSTIDSGISAASSLWVTDIAREKGDKSSILSARLSMVGITIVGLLLAYVAHFIPGFGLQHLWFLSISIVASISVPTILSLYWDRLSAKGVFYGSLISLVIGIPTFFYANLVGDIVLQVSSSIFMIVVSTLFCLIFRRKTLLHIEP